MNRLLDFWLLGIVLLFVAVAIMGCETNAPLVLPPQKCTPAVDLPASKMVEQWPERDVPNDEFFALVLKERAGRAMDIQDYNSLYRTCVTGESNGVGQ